MSEKREAELVQEVHQALERDMETLGLDINIAVRGGEVILTGIVDWLAEKEKAEAITRQVKGVINVENALTMTMDGELSDNDIETDIMDSLEDAQLTEMGVKVNDGTVTLMGHAEVDAKEHAQDLIRHVRGVKEVVSKVKQE